MSCPVCLEDYQRPKGLPRVLPCGHSMCSACIVRMGDSGRLHCPLDRSQTMFVQGSGTAQFVLNHELIAALNLKGPTDVKARTVVTCSACSKVILCPPGLTFADESNGLLSQLQGGAVSRL